MRAHNLGFISDSDLFSHVKDTILRYRRSINLKEFNHSIIDPIKLTFDAKVYGKSYAEIIEAECLRQIDKSNTNHIGYFHQNIFKYIGKGWSVPEQGYDIVNLERHIYVELKNKHNTMNSSSATQTYSRMQNQLLHDDEAVCMLVEVISKKSINETWVWNKLSHRKIRKVSIDKFYEFALGKEYKYAFSNLCKVLPIVLEDVLSSLNLTQGLDNSVYQELSSNYSQDSFKSLFLLAFKTYEGFDEF